MNWTFESFVKPEYIRIVNGGIFKSVDFARMFDELFELTDWHFGIPLFFDSRELNVSEITPVEMIDASNGFINRNPELAFTRIAVLFGDNESFEIAGRFYSITQSASKALVRLFTDEDEALKWLVPGAPIHATQGY